MERVYRIDGAGREHVRCWRAGIVCISLADLLDPLFAQRIKSLQRTRSRPGGWLRTSIDAKISPTEHFQHVRRPSGGKALGDSRWRRHNCQIIGSWLLSGVAIVDGLRMGENRRSGVFTTAHYSAVERLIRNARKADGTALRRRFCSNFRLPLTVKFLAPTKRAFHVVAIARKAWKQRVSRHASFGPDQKLLLNRTSSGQ